MAERYFVSGNGTGIGKTYVSALLCRAIGASYWKPVQCGSLEDSDSDFVHRYSGATIIKERFSLAAPESPHSAAKKEGLSIRLSDFVLREQNEDVLIEGAGGLLVPLNDSGESMYDLSRFLETKLILVCGYYLGAINHTSLSIDFLLSKGNKNFLVVLNGRWEEQARQYIRSRYPEVIFMYIKENQNFDLKFREYVSLKLKELEPGFVR